MFTPIEPDVIPVEKRWRVHKIEPGNQVKGFKVGPLVMVEVHWADPHSKPCRCSITGGKVPCPCKEEMWATRKIGYLPLQTALGENVVVILSNSVAAIVKPLKQGAPISLSRSLVPKTPLRYSVWGDYECGAEKRKRVEKYAPANIQPFLLHLWGDQVLNEYFAQLLANPPGPTLPPPPPPPPFKKPTRSELITQVVGVNEKIWNPAGQE